MADAVVVTLLLWLLVLFLVKKVSIGGQHDKYGQGVRQKIMPHDQPASDKQQAAHCHHSKRMVTFNTHQATQVLL